MLMLSFLGAWFLMTPLSSPLWQYLPVLHKVQFPWRVMVLQEFAVVTTVMLTLSHCIAERRGVYYLIAGGIAVSMLVWVGYRAAGGYEVRLRNEQNLNGLFYVVLQTEQARIVQKIVTYH